MEMKQQQVDRPAARDLAKERISLCELRTTFLYNGATIMLTVSLKSFLRKLFWKERNAGQIFVASIVGDPDPEPQHVFGPPGSGSISLSDGSGSGSESINFLSGLK
jgi:hypothetical protein